MIFFLTQFCDVHLLFFLSSSSMHLAFIRSSLISTLSWSGSLIHWTQGRDRPWRKYTVALMWNECKHENIVQDMSRIIFARCLDSVNLCNMQLLSTLIRSTCITECQSVSTRFFSTDEIQLLTTNKVLSKWQRNSKPFPWE